MSSSVLFRSSSQLQFIHWSPSLTAAPGGGGAVYNDSALLVFSRSAILMNKCSCGWICFIGCRGPLCLLQFQLGVLSRGRIGPLQLAIEYIKTGQSIAVRFLHIHAVCRIVKCYHRTCTQSLALFGCYL